MARECVFSFSCLLYGVIHLKPWFAVRSYLAQPLKPFPLVTNPWVPATVSLTAKLPQQALAPTGSPPTRLHRAVAITILQKIRAVPRSTHPIAAALVLPMPQQHYLLHVHTHLIVALAPREQRLVHRSRPL